MAALHDDEITLDTEQVRQLLRAQKPQWADLPLTPAGAGTDNTMLRLGDDLLLRLPRRPSTAADVAKEQRWLPRLAPHLPLEIPTPVAQGASQDDYPFPWSVYRWIEGSEPGPDTVTDWARLGADLAGFIRALHSVDLMGATSQDPGLHWYRCEPLAQLADAGREAIQELRDGPPLDIDLDLDAVAARWEHVVDVPDPVRPPSWLHSDLRAANLLVRDGHLCAVVDFGALSVGNPTAEHAACWDLPPQGRVAYRETLGLDEATWQRAQGWALLPSLTGATYYRDTWPEFVLQCLEKVRLVTTAPDAG